MKMLKRVGIFPVDQESITLFENIHECRYGEIMHIASIKAWGLCGKKIQRCDGSEIIIEEGIGNIIKECEVLILLESWHDASPARPLVYPVPETLQSMQSRKLLSLV